MKRLALKLVTVCALLGMVTQKAAAQGDGPRRLVVKLGYGTMMMDTAVTEFFSDGSRARNQKNRLVKMDVYYRFAGVKSDPDERSGYGRGHAAGIFMTGGLLNAASSRAVLGSKGSKLDASVGRNRFFELEAGAMINEHLRVSAGAGRLWFTEKVGDRQVHGVQPYYTVTLGASPRLFDLVEVDLAATQLFVDGRHWFRASATVGVFVRALRR